MRGFTRIGLMAAAVLACLGLSICFIAFALGFRAGEIVGMVQGGAFDYGPNGNSFLSGGDWQIRDGYSFSADSIHSIDLQFNFGEVWVTPASGDYIEVSISSPSQGGSADREILVQEDAGTLSIRDRDGKQRWWNWGNRLGKWTLTLAIPEDKRYNDVSLEIGAGQLLVSSMVQSEGMSLTVGAGSMRLDRVVAGRLMVESGAGEVQILQVDAGEVDVSCGIGRVDLGMASPINAYNFALDVGIGEVRLGNQSFSGLGHSKTIHNVDGGPTITIQCGIGAVNLSFPGI